MVKIIGLGSVPTGQVHVVPPVTAPGPVTPLPALIETGGQLHLRPITPSFPLPTAQGAFCWPVRNACFTSQATKDEAMSMCSSGQKPTREPGGGCPIGSPRIDPYGSRGETSASSFDPCLIKDFPVCSAGSRFGDLSRWQDPMQVEYGGIFGVDEVKASTHAKTIGAIIGGIGLGFLIGKWVLRW